MRPSVTGPLFALASFGVFASHDAVVKLLGGTYSPFQLIFFSVLFGLPLAMFMLLRDSHPGTLRPVHPWWSALRTFTVMTTGVAGFYAFSTLPLAQVYALLFASPLFVTMLSIPILGETVGRHRWAAVLVGLVGVFVVLRPWSADQVLSLGHAAALIAAAGSALSAVIMRRVARAERGVVLMLIPMLANFIVMGALMPWVYKPMPVADLGWMAVIAGFGFIAGLLMIAAYRRADAAIVAPMHYSQIIWAAIFGAAFFDETPDVMTWIGAAIIIASGIYVVVRESTGASDNAPVLRTRPRPETGTSPRVVAALRRRAEPPPPGHEALARRRASE
ncbi:DMT family transporter [Palleronia sediminis]|uniref:DMT family transporter n=1 Tax=Palleronia sediminis TaxID=2547833 RepID=A0A4R6AED9_9RHOB|nr:DMT family transporter [Palleronia sediminis]TDL81495.1 DMT family transporter [Palleronia sediminis]